MIIGGLVRIAFAFGIGGNLFDFVLFSGDKSLLFMFRSQFVLFVVLFVMVLFTMIEDAFFLFVG